MMQNLKGKFSRKANFKEGKFFGQFYGIKNFLDNYFFYNWQIKGESSKMNLEMYL